MTLFIKDMSDAAEELERRLEKAIKVVKDNLMTFYKSKSHMMLIEGQQGLYRC